MSTSNDGSCKADSIFSFLMWFVLFVFVASQCSSQEHRPSYADLYKIEDQLTRIEEKIRQQNDDARVMKREIESIRIDVHKLLYKP